MILYVFNTEGSEQENSHVYWSRYLTVNTLSENKPAVDEVLNQHFGTTKLTFESGNEFRDNVLWTDNEILESLAEAGFPAFFLQPAFVTQCEPRQPPTPEGVEITKLTPKVFVRSCLG